MFIQVDFSLAIDTKKLTRVNVRPLNMQLTNYRVKTEDGYKNVEHGNIFELITPDPVDQPLLSFEIIQAAYVLHRIVGAFKEAGFLRQVFRGDPPDVDTVTTNPSTSLSE